MFTRGSTVLEKGISDSKVVIRAFRHGMSLVAATSRQYFSVTKKTIISENGALNQSKFSLFMDRFDKRPLRGKTVLFV